MRNTTRTAGMVLAAAAGVMAMGAPAFAATPASEHHEHGAIHHNHEANGVTVADDNNVQVPIGACGNNVGALIGAAVPILSPQTIGSCAAAGIDQS